MQIEDSGDYVCQAIGFSNHIPGQSVHVSLIVEQRKCIPFEITIF